MNYQDLNNNNKGGRSSSTDNTRFQSPIVDESLLVRIEEEKTPIDRISVRVLGLSKRISRVLGSAYIDSIRQLVNCTDGELLKIQNLGATGLDEIKHKLNSYLQGMLVSNDWHTQVIDVSKYSDRNNGSLLEVEYTIKSYSGIAHKLLLEKLKNEKPPIDKIGVQVLGLSARGYNALKNANINTIQKLIDCPRSDLVSIRNVGVTTLDDIRNKLNSYINTTLRTGDWYSQVVDTSADKEGRPALLEQVETTSTLGEAIDELFKTLKDSRQSMIVRQRYGLDDIAPHTLEDLGRQLRVTRERVRQIEKKTLPRLLHPTRKQILERIVQPFEFVFQRAAGVMNTRQLIEEIQNEEELGEINVAGAASFVLSISVKFLKIRGDIWALSNYSTDLIEEVRTSAVSLLKKNLSSMRLEELISNIVKVVTSNKANAESRIDRPFVTACLKAYPDFIIVDGEWIGLESWDNTIRDELVMALRQIGEPVHYEALTEKTNTLLPLDKHVKSHNVYALMQRLPDLFVRVGQGVFALKEWNPQSDNSLADAAYRVLREAGQPLHIRNITEKVLRTWRVNPASIYAAVQSDDRFYRIGFARFCLREQISGEIKYEAGADFGELFVGNLVEWQTELEHYQENVDLNTHAEIDRLRIMGVTFLRSD